MGTAYEKVQEAVTITEKLFKGIFDGPLAEDFDRLRRVVSEILENDPAAWSRLLTDRYGLEDSPQLRFMVRFCFPALMNGEGLGGVFSRCGKRADTPGGVCVG